MNYIKEALKTENINKDAVTVGFTFEEIQEANIKKLRVRYPEKFTERKRT